jgi:hypothetical protein
VRENFFELSLREPFATAFKDWCDDWNRDASPRDQLTPLGAMERFCRGPLGLEERGEA